MDNNIYEKIKKILTEPKELSDIVSECDLKTLDVINCLNELYSKNQIEKTITKDDDIFFSLNNDLKNNESLNDDSNLENNIDYHNISKLARKFRSSRYHVERDFTIKNLVVSLKISKKDKQYFIFYISSIDFFKTKSIFNDILQIDSSIRIVSPNESIKLSICKLFDDYIDLQYGDNGYNDFRKKYSFKILTMEQFFKKTTWKNLLN